MEHKNLKIMAATNWTIIKKNKETNQIVMFNLEEKWTYKTAIGIATELNNNETNEIVCIVETSKILLKDDKEKEKNENGIGLHNDNIEEIERKKAINQMNKLQNLTNILS